MSMQHIRINRARLERAPVPELRGVGSLGTPNSKPFRMPRIGTGAPHRFLWSSFVPHNRACLAEALPEPHLHLFLILSLRSLSNLHCSKVPHWLLAHLADTTPLQYFTFMLCWTGTFCDNTAALTQLVRCWSRKLASASWSLLALASSGAAPRHHVNIHQKGGGIVENGESWRMENVTQSRRGESWRHALARRRWKSVRTSQHVTQSQGR